MHCISERREHTAVANTHVEDLCVGGVAVLLNDMAMTTNKQKTPGASDPGRYMRESVATYVLLRPGEHERVKERNPSKASTKAPSCIYSGVILLYQLQKNALLRVPVSGCERTSACVHRFSS